MTTQTTLDKNSKSARGTLTRPRYAPGLLLEADDLTVAVDHASNLSSLLMRSLFGCGVICGLELTGTPICENRQLLLAVGCGVALDCTGHVIEVGRIEPFLIGDACTLPKPDVANIHWLAVRRREEKCSPRELVCAGDEDVVPMTHTRLVDGFELRLFAGQRPCACGCVSNRPDAPVAGNVTTATGNEQLAAGAGGAGAAVQPAAQPAAGPVRYIYSTGAGDCYEGHAGGICEGANRCGEGWVLLGMIDIRLAAGNQTISATIDHGYRRYVRPVLAPDPVAAKK
jgi:hypothetical protein